MGTDQTLPTVAYPVDAIAQATFGALMERLRDPGQPPRVHVVPNLFVPPSPAQLRPAQPVMRSAATR
jgi:hypothetical protein